MKDACILSYSLAQKLTVSEIEQVSAGGHVVIEATRGPGGYGGVIEVGFPVPLP